MKKKLLAAALSCAVMAMASVPSAMAANSSASGQVSSQGDGITFTDGDGKGYQILGTSTDATLAGDVASCYVDALGVINASKYFTVTDTDNVPGHNITVAASEENFLVGVGGSIIPTSALELTFEGSQNPSECPEQSEEILSDIAEKLAGPPTIILSDSLTLSEEAYDSTSGVSYLPLSTSPETLMTSSASEALQYKFRLGGVKMTFPQYTKPGTYSSTLVYTYNASN